jgi:hypothetical protein
MTTKCATKTCASCNVVIKAVGGRKECAKCARFTTKIRNSVNCANYYRKTHHPTEFCGAGDLIAIFREASRIPAQSKGPTGMRPHHIDL